MGLHQERHARDDLARGAGNALLSALDWGGISLILIASLILKRDHVEPQRNAERLQATAGMFECDLGVLVVQDAARTHALVRSDSAYFVNPTGAGAQPAADHRGRACERTFALEPTADPAALQARLEAVLRDAVATVLRGGHRTTFCLIAVPDGQPHAKETP
jgi:nucleotide-binding universal stress UspA family protein